MFGKILCVDERWLMTAVFCILPPISVRNISSEFISSYSNKKKMEKRNECISKKSDSLLG